MSLFSDHLHWRSVVNWPIGAFGVLLTIAGWMRLANHVVLALLFITAAAILGIGKVLYMAWSPPDQSLWDRIGFSVVCSGFLLAMAAAVVTGLGDGPVLPGPSPTPTIAEEPDKGEANGPTQSTTPRPTAESRREPPEERKSDAPSVPSARSGPDAPSVTVPSPAVVDSSDCPPAAAPDVAPDVTLRPGDLIVAGGGEIYRLDSAMKETWVASGQHVANARGVAVDPMGRILVSSRACNEGVIVSVDPKSGVQTPLVGGFGHTQGILPAKEQDTVLVGDEDPKDKVWGHLWRVNLKTREKESLYAFPREGAAAPTSIGFDPKSSELHFAAKRVYRMSPEGPRQLSLGVSNVHAIVFARTGEMFMAEYDGGPVVQVDLPARKVVKTYQGFPTIWSMAVARDGKSVFVGSGSGGNAILIRVPTSGESAETVWRAHVSEGIGVFVTVVGEIRQ